MRSIAENAGTVAIGKGLAGIARLLLAWPERARQRRALARLDDRQLRDIGLDRVDLEREIVKPPWRQ